MPKKMTLNQFIERAKIKHGDKYDYSKTKYISANKKVEIICPQHGEFWQSASDHFAHGCSKCGAHRMSKSHIYSFEQFKNKSIEKHGTRYTYCNEGYTSAKSKIKIICQQHGEFWQTAESHYNGQGCMKCGVQSSSSKRTKNTQNFINKANKIHNNKYDYSKVNYINCSIHVEIICKVHGSFLQRPIVHTSNKSGCRLCNKTASNKECKWLDNLNIPIQNRNIKLPKLGRIIVDGWDGNNTVYEFNGSFWHGDPRVYKKEDINWVNNKSFGELYDNTLKKAARILAAGYDLVTMWEEDYKSLEASVANSDLSPLTKVT